MIQITLEDDNAIRVAAWISNLLFENRNLPDHCGEDFAPLLDQIDSQSKMIDVLECSGEVEWVRSPSTTPGRIWE